MAHITGKKRTAYKFFNSRFFDAIFSEGSIKIGTAKSFRSADSIIGGRNDPSEGVRIWAPSAGEHQAPLEFLTSMGVAPAVAKSAGLKMVFEDGTKLTLNRDCYMYCMSKKVTDLMVRRMRADFDCDMAFKILDLPAFFEAILDADPRLSANPEDPFGTHVTVANVKYARLSLEAEHYRLIDFFEKDLSYRWQCEQRAVFGGAGPYEPFILSAPNIRRHIKLVRLP